MHHWIIAQKRMTLPRGKRSDKGMAYHYIMEVKDMELCSFYIEEKRQSKQNKSQKLF